MRKKILLLIAAAILALPNFIDADINGAMHHNGKEKFDISTRHLNSIDALENFVDSIATSRSVAIPSPEYLLILEEAISLRFYHGFSHWKLNENWIAALGQKVTGVGVACKVRADDILKDPNAACSQQALVTMAMLRKKGIEYRPVYFPHHYALEAHIGDRWYYIDANMEPNMDLTSRMHRNWQSNNEILKRYYPAEDSMQLNYRFGKSKKASLGPVNDMPAKNARAFQSATAVASKSAWLLPLAIIFLRRRKKEK